MRRARRRLLPHLLLGAVGMGAAFVAGSMLRADVYVATADVGLRPVSPRSLYDPDARSWSSGEARAAEQRFLEGDELQAALEAELPFPHELDVSWVAPDRLRFEAEAETAELAVAAAASSGAVYGAVRDEQAAAAAAAIAAGQATLVADQEAAAAGGDPDAAAALEGSRERLELARAAIPSIEAGTAWVVADVAVPCCPEGPTPVQAGAVGVLLGLVAGAGTSALVSLADDPRRGRRLRSARVLLGSTGSAPRSEGGPGGGASPDPLRATCTTWWAGWQGWRGPLSVLAGLVLARGLLLAVLGTNLVLDDLVLSYYAERGGPLEVVPSGQDLYLARPGAWLTFTVLYGTLGGHPLALLGVVSVLNLLVAGLLFAVLRRVVTDHQALWVAVLWVLLPNHTTLTAWAGTTQVVVGLVLLLAGALALLHRRPLLGGVALAASILCYELAIPAALLAPVLAASPVVPWRADRAGPRPLGLRDRLVALAPVVAATAWSLTHAIYDVAPSLPDVLQVWDAHVGIGLWGSASTPDVLLVLSGALVAGGAGTCVAAYLLGDRRRPSGPPLVVAGLVLLGVGLPVAFTLGVHPLGMEDRVYGISTIGMALVLVGIGSWLWPRARNLAVLLGVALLAACLVGQVVALRSWRDAGRDVVALVRYVDALPDPARTHVWVEPGPLGRNGVLGTVSPTGGANEAYLRAHPEADPDGPFVGEPATGSLTIADGLGTPPPEGALVVTWDQVLRGPPDDRAD